MDKSPAYARNSVQTTDFRPVCLKSSLIGFWMKTEESAKEKGALRSIALLSYRVFACLAGLCRFVKVGRLRDQRDLYKSSMTEQFYRSKNSWISGLFYRCFDLELVIVYSIHRETMICEKMNYQSNCNIIRFRLQRRPIVLMHLRSTKLVLGHVFIMLKSSG